MLVLGDMLELGEGSAEHHLALGPLLERLCGTVSLAELVLVGREMAPLADGLAGCLGETEILYEPDSDDACMVRIAARLADGDTVLLKASRGVGLERVIEHLDSGALAG